VKRGRRDDGSATIYVLALAAVVWLAGFVVLLLAHVAVARSRAATAADLAALAGAAHVVDGRACAVARSVVLAQDAELTSCVVDGSDVRVLVRVPLGPPLSRFPPAQGRARAGPVTTSRS
jgi:secretion/DNA translocation related TadE-like protein